MSKSKEPKIPYVYFHDTWSTSEGRLPLPPRRATAVRIEEYQGFHKRHIYCPKCGVPCYKSPQNSGHDRSARPAHFAHRPGYQDIPCDLRTETGAGKRYEDEQVQGRAVDSDDAVVITCWRDVADEAELTGKEGVYRGVVEDQSAPADGGAINRHVGEHLSLPQHSGSLFSIAAHLDEYMTRNIQLPGSPHPEPLADVLAPLHEINGEGHPIEEKIFWGRIIDAFAGNIYLFVNVMNDAGHYVSVQIPWRAAKARRMRADNVANRFILAHGSLQRDVGREVKLKRPGRVSCWHVRVEHVGQVSLVPPDFESLLSNGRL